MIVNCVISSVKGSAIRTVTLIAGKSIANGGDVSELVDSCRPVSTWNGRKPTEDPGDAGVFVNPATLFNTQVVPAAGTPMN